MARRFFAAHNLKFHPKFPGSAGLWKYCIGAFTVLMVIAVAPSLCCASESQLPADSGFGLIGQHDIIRGPSGYLAWYKLLSVAIVFLIWVRLSDWINRDTQKIGEDTGYTPEVWNPISLGAFLVGFWCALSIPIFWIGFPVMVLSAFTPFIIYVLMRRSVLSARPRLKEKLSGDPNRQQLEALPQDDGLPIDFTAAGEEESRQVNLIRARQTPAFHNLKEMVFDGVNRRAEVIILDFLRDRVNGQMLVDGAWHGLPVMTREVGDSILVGLKYLAGTNPNDRRKRQIGECRAKVDGINYQLRLTTQGVQTGERAELKFVAKRKTDFTLPELGMWPDMIRRYTMMLNQPGLVIVSAPPRHGLTTNWRATLNAADRITRDWVGVSDKNDRETEVENITMHYFDKEAGQSPTSVMRGILLTQPDGVAVSNVVNAQSLDQLTEQAVTQDRTILTRITADSAADALVRLYAVAKNKKQFAEAVTCVIGQRLARRLCDTCKQPVQVQPQLIQKIGGDPRKTNTLFNAFKMPPPEQRVDEKGRPVEIPPCATCSALGYIGRISIYEMIAINDQIRASLFKKPTVETIQQIARKTGNQNLISAGYQLALLGITSLAEIQRVMKG